MAFKTFPMQYLPLPALSDRLTSNLRPDPETPSVAVFQNELLKERPSIQRRSREVAPSSHFSFTTPMPLPFPYRIPQPKDVTEDDRESLSRSIEEWLAHYEPLKQEEAFDCSLEDRCSTLVKSSAVENQFAKSRRLLAFSGTCASDCLPALDCGDARALVEDGVAEQSCSENLSSQRKRDDMIDVLCGQSALLSREAQSQEAYGPWSLRYCGHQFGVWAGQLGDGRAISILETPHPQKPGVSYEIQLKGAGRTPYSRSADGLAVLRSSVREFLGAEAVHALGIPTTRALSLISLPDIPVHREQVESACVTSRVAESFIRIGSFEAHNPPESTVVYLFGPEASQTSKTDYEGLRVLGEWVARKVLRLEHGIEKPWAANLVRECARRNALMVAGWQAYGFMHGVMNTDNISIAGLTLDYGPYAFMDQYDYAKICNHTDEAGRYAFKLQPTMIVYAVRALLRALAPAIGAEAETGRPLQKGWADSADAEKFKEWGRNGESLGTELDQLVMTTFDNKYHELMRARLGLKTEGTDDRKLIQGLLDVLQEFESDFHQTLRALRGFDPSMLEKGVEASAFVSRLNESIVDSTKHERAAKAWLEWLHLYAIRIGREDSENAEREEAMRKVNPRFVLRQWVLEDVIKVCERGNLKDSRRILAKVLRMANSPFDRWGGEGKPDSSLSVDEKEERRYCGLGPEKYLGFQCSCSS